MMDDIQIAVAASVWAMRSHSGLSTRALADGSACSRASASHIETGKRMPTVGMLWRIAKTCGFTLTEATTIVEDVADRRLETIAQGRLHAQISIDRLRPHQTTTAP